MNIPVITILVIIIIWLFVMILFMSSDLCKLHGHKIGGGYYEREGGQYFNVQVGGIDGIDRVHCQLYTECERCGEKFQVGQIHLPLVDDWIADKLKKPKKSKT